MNKVKLQLEDLQVESFEVEADTAEVGTVHGQQVHAESGVPSGCNTWCTNCCSQNPTNCEYDRECALSLHVSCRYTDCPNAYTCNFTDCYPCWVETQPE